MNWKASVLGALFVAAAGLAVGVAIGGKTSTHVVSVTVLKRIKVTAAAPPTATTKTSATETDASTAPAGSSTNVTSTSTGTTSVAANTTSTGGVQEQFLASYLESQGGSTTLDRNAQNVSLDEHPSEQELAGQTYPHAVAFDLASSESGATASYQIPAPGFARLSANAAGFDTTSNANASYRLTVYKNNDSSPASVILYQTTFHGPSTVRKIGFATGGATDLVFVWTALTSEPEGEVFVLAEPILDGGS